MDAALQRVSKARVEEMRREGVKRRRARCEQVVADRARHVALLLLLRIVCEIVGDGAGHRRRSYDLWGSWRTRADRRRRHDRRQLRAGRRRPAHARPPARLRGRARRPRGWSGWLGRVLGPLATLLILIGNTITPGRGFRDGPFSSEVELRELVDMAEERGVVESGERNMIHSVFELGDTIAREVMVPRTDVVWIERTQDRAPGAGARAAQRLQPHAGDRRERRRRRRRRLPQGPRPRASQSDPDRARDPASRS